ncbi:MAG: DUF1592 domain-containing protein, partial [Pseudomonadota bacterium]|nr:DUF1592 domain-containing protein [Pseudomonadota bacterium]
MVSRFQQLFDRRIVTLPAIFSLLLLSHPLYSQSLQSGGELMQATLQQFCIACHNDSLQSGNLSFQKIDLTQVSGHGAIPERLLAQLRSGRMPPVGMPRPDHNTYTSLITWLETEIDKLAVANPNPGRTDTFHRLNRSEYANAVRDLLSLEVNVEELLPADDIDAYGFDNMTEVLNVSPALMESYLSAARKTARMSIGESPLAPIAETYEVPILLNQADRMSEDLPFGSRGGLAVRHYFPADGDYDLAITLHRNYVNYVRGLGSSHELEVRLDGKLVQTFSFGGEEPDVLQAPASYAGNQFGDSEWEEYMLFADSNLLLQFPATAGPHVVGVSFVRKFTEPEGVLQPPQSVFAAAVNEMRDGDAAVERMEITGPYRSTPARNTPSRRAIFTCQPANDTGRAQEACAYGILASLAQRAYRRPVGDAEVNMLMNFYRAGLSDGSFDDGIQLALERLLISPDFLFRVERDPANIEPDTNYQLTSIELASRLSFFLWSSIPDIELLDSAKNGTLQNPQVLEQQTRRMLADPRSKALVQNFAGQWLYLRNLRSLVPDAVEFPEFDENLRDAFRQESELFFESLIRENRSVTDLLGNGYT